jgi:hypothetical protein
VDEISFESTTYSVYRMSVELHDQFLSFTCQSINERTGKSHSHACGLSPFLEGGRKEEGKLGNVCIM